MNLCGQGSLFRQSVENGGGPSTRCTTTETSMKYLLLVHLDETRLQAQSKEEWTQLDKDSFEYDRELERSGHYITSAALRDPREAVIVRRDGESFATTD